jgi:hypothetical protein
MESFNRHLKEEGRRHIPLPTFEELKPIIAEQIHFFNDEQI